jgi:hypothetical protein
MDKFGWYWILQENTDYWGEGAFYRCASSGMTEAGHCDGKEFLPLINGDRLSDLQITAEGDIIFSSHSTRSSYNYLRKLEILEPHSGGKDQTFYFNPFGHNAMTALLSADGYYVVGDDNHVRKCRLGYFSSGNEAWFQSCYSVGKTVGKVVDVKQAPSGDYLAVDREDGKVVRCTGEGYLLGCRPVAGHGGSGRQQVLKDPVAVELTDDHQYVIIDHAQRDIRLCPASGSGDCTILVGPSMFQDAAPVGITIPYNSKTAGIEKIRQLARESWE